MGWRKTGTFQTPQEILVMTCDVCERDIGHEDGRRPKAHYEINRVPNPGTIDKQNPPIFVCSVECLRTFASKTTDPGHVPPRRATVLSRVKPQEE